MMWRALALLLMLPLVAHAQRGTRRQRPEDSHIAVSPSASELTPTELLHQKLNEVEWPDYIQNLLSENNIDSERARKLLQHPLANDILKRLADGDPALMKLAERVAAGRPELRGMSSDALRNLISDRAASLLDPSKKPLDLTPRVNPDFRPPTLAERERLARQAYTERITDMLHDMRMDNLLDQLRDAPAFQNWIQELGKAQNSSESPLTLGDTMNVLGGADEWLKRIRPYLPKNLPSLSRLEFTSRAPPSVNLPALDFGRSLPSFSLGSHWSVYFVSIAAIAVALIALLRLRKNPRQILSLATARLGPWPVDPRRISTREDVIAAFEYLALLRCGDDANHWHHHDVARNLSRNPATRQDAESLASLYEVARYAPIDRPGMWQAAREPLSRLAEGTA